MNHAFSCDLHLHTVLSPCADLSMSPLLMLPLLLKYSISIIAITDHNSVLNYPAFQDFPNHGIQVIPGMELTTREELHLLALFPDYSSAMDFQSEVDSRRLPMPNEPELFGHQYIINSREEILGEESVMLSQAIPISLEDAVDAIHQVNGLAIPAHIDRPRFSIISQLGFIPPSLAIDGIEVTRVQAADPYWNRYPVILSSDAHALSMLHPSPCRLEAPRASFEDLRLGLAGQEGRRIMIV
ncbi:MAG: PHP domain-containing protein [Candidatus Delongbacteria bacterium]|nr:PHP domain-containing protein [Candidatus Delongbacteria bacterium]